MWYAFAPYASRVVGRALIATDAALKQLALLTARFSGGIPSLSYLTGKGPGSLRDDLTLMAGLILVSMDAGAAATASGPLYELAVWKQVLSALIALVGPAPSSSCAGFSCCGSVWTVKDCWGAVSSGVATIPKVLATLRNALAQGNRLIFADIGVIGEKYLKWRDFYLGKNKKEVIKGSTVMSVFCPTVAAKGKQDCEVVEKEIVARVKRAASGSQSTGDLSDFTFAAGKNIALKCASFALFEDVRNTTAHVVFLSLVCGVLVRGLESLFVVLMLAQGKSCHAAAAARP